MEQTRIEEQITEIAGDVKAINAKLDSLNQLNHERRLSELEKWSASQQGFQKAVQLVIGLIGVAVGAGIKFLLN